MSGGSCIRTKIGYAVNLAVGPIAAPDRLGTLQRLASEPGVGRIRDKVFQAAAQIFDSLQIFSVFPGAMGGRPLALVEASGLLERERQAGCHEHNRVRLGGDGGVEAPLRVAEGAGERVIGHDAKTDLVRNRNDGSRRGA